jgi:hypothetical protein
VSQCELLPSSYGRLSIYMFSRVNAVETLYSAFPAFMYIDPGLGAPLLEPLFRVQASSQHPIPYAAADLGTSRINSNSRRFRQYSVGSSYPNVTVTNSSHNQGVERTYVSRWFCAFLIGPIHRIWEYADHDIRPCTRYWRRKPHK